MERCHREHFWDAIVWPLLWPLLLVQAALVLLCLAVGAAMWWMSPSYVAWSTMLWLTLALLVGSILNVCVFLMLVKARARLKDTRFMQELIELEQHSQALCEAAVHSLPNSKCNPPKAVDESLRPLQRLAGVNETLAELERCMHRSKANEAAFKNSQYEHEQILLDDLQQQQRQLKHLMAGRDRAREESRLKSGYLTLLQREADSLYEHLNTQAANKITDDCREIVTDVSERLSDMRALLVNLVHERAGDVNEIDSRPAKRHLRVLVVDDGPVNLMLARQMLESQGLQVEGVSSGEQALKRQQKVLFDLVFMDIFMPALDGLETTRRWRDYERRQGRRRSVLVALTANAESASLDDCLAAGLDDLLAKPYQPETLINIIAKWFPSTVKVPQPK
ncbi:MAG: response regulator [Halomonas sp.]|nr:response regulator [Halomonas sp.]TVP45169.1 MAG: response regulator [Halomonas sp.]